MRVQGVLKMWKKTKTDVEKLKESKMRPEFFLRSHKCEMCERIYAHQCKTYHARYICPECAKEKQS